MSEATTELVLDLDTSEAEVSLEAFEKALEGLQETVSGFSKTLQKSLGLLQASLHKTVAGVNALNKSVQSLMQQMSKEQSADQLAEGISTAIEGISVFATVIKPAKKAMESIVKAIGEYAEAVKFAAPESGTLAAVFPKLSGILVNLSTIFKGSGGKILGVLSKFGPKIAVIVAIATIAISAIIAIVENWDKISSAVQTFVTETLIRAWGQLTQWFQNTGAAIVSAINQTLRVMAGMLSACWNQITTLWGGLVAWFQSTILQPFIEKWSGAWEWIKQLLGSALQTVLDVVYNIGVIISGSWEIIKAVWSLAVQWVQEQVIVPICNAWNTVCAAVENALAIVRECLVQACSWIYANVLAPLGELLCGIWDGFVSGAKAAWEGVKTVFSKVADFFVSTFRAAWQGIVKVFSVAGEIFADIKDGIFEAFKLIVNSLIKGINAVVKIPFDAINGALQTMRNIKIFDITPFSGLRSISVPQIPYLAKGAVLPANKPVLAMVGDQRHGTNVEAPLATIQEAVAVVLDEQLSALMAGFNATVQEIRLLRETVGNIRVGDDVIYRAAERYREKRAVMHGTGW